MALESNTATVGGLRAAELYYRPIRNLSDDEVVFFQTRLRLNTPNLGVLMPEDFQPVAELSEQYAAVFKLALVQLLGAVEKFSDREIRPSWISLSMPARFLRRIDCVKTISDLCGKFRIDPQKLCFELMPDFLNSADADTAESINALRRNGFRFMLSHFDDKTSILGLSAYNIDYVILGDAYTEAVLGGERSENVVKNIIGSLNDIEIEPIALISADNHSACERLQENGCLYYVGESAGKFVAERYVRKRTE